MLSKYYIRLRILRYRSLHPSSPSVFSFSIRTSINGFSILRFVVVIMASEWVHRFDPIFGMRWLDVEERRLGVTCGNAVQIALVEVERRLAHVSVAKAVLW